MTTLETERLILRNFRPDDWQELLELAIKYQASAWAQYDHPWPTEEDKVRQMAEWLATEEGFLTVCVKEPGRLIGLLNIHHNQEIEDARVHGLGYVFHPDYHGQGYATEACRAGLNHVFGPRAADRVTTGTHPDNEPSVRLLTRLRLKEIKRGEYAISREEWLASDPGEASDTTSSSESKLRL